MPNMAPYEVSVLPEGEIGGRRATAEDFGAGPGLENLGRSLSQAAQTFNDVQDDQARIWASTAASAQETALKQRWSDRINSLDPTNPSYGHQLASLTDDATTLWAEGASDIQATAPNQRAAAYAGELMDRARVSFTGQVIGQQAKLNADYTTGLVKDGISEGTDLISQSPDNATVMRLTEQQIQTIAGTKSIDPLVKQALVEEVKNTYAQAQAQAWVKLHPGDFLAGVDPSAGIQIPAPGPVQGLKDATGKATQALVSAVIKQESGGNPKAVSPKGAQGLMQVMPATASTVGYAPEDLADPEKNVAAGTAYLNQQLQMFGDPRLALAAYNAGPAKVSQLIAKHGNSYEAIAPYLPKETQGYVPSVLAHAGITTASSLPQVQPLPEAKIAAAHPPLAGWDNLSFAQKVGYVRQAEAQQGESLAAGRAFLRGSLSDTNAMALAGQRLDPKTEQQFSQQNLVTYFGPAEGTRLAAEHAAAVQFGQFKQQVATMPAAQRDALVASSQPSGVGADAAMPMWNQMRAAAQSAAQDQQKQWTDYALANGIGGAKPLDTSSDQATMASLADRQKLMLTGTQEYGITKPTIFSTAEAATIGAKLDKLDPDQRFNFMVNMGTALNNPVARQVAFNQIAPGRQDLVNATDIALKPATIAFHGGDSETAQQVAKKVMQGDYILNGGLSAAGKPGSPDAPQPGGKGALGLNTQLFSQTYNSIVGPNAFAGGDANYQNGVSGQMYKMALDYYAADAQARGLDASNPAHADIQRAVDAVTGGVWKRGNSALFAPYGMKMEDFQDQFEPRAKQALIAAGYDAQQVEALAGGLRPYNAGDGKYGFMNGTRILRNKSDTAPVLVDFSQPVPVLPNQSETEIPVNADARAALSAIGK